jgi:uncharacterized protein (DUF2147 family)
MAPIALYAVLALATPLSAGPIEGLWMNPDKSVIIRMEPCGEALCGTVTWASEQAQRDARKGAGRLIGARLLSGFERNSRGVWKGKIFLPDYGMQVRGKIQPVDSLRLKVSGCTLGGFLCRTQIWTRSDGPVAGSD